MPRSPRLSHIQLQASWLCSPPSLLFLRQHWYYSCSPLDFHHCLKGTGSNLACFCSLLVVRRLQQGPVIVHGLLPSIGTHRHISLRFCVIDNLPSSRLCCCSWLDALTGLERIPDVLLRPLDCSTRRFSRAGPYCVGSPLACCNANAGVASTMVC